MGKSDFSLSPIVWTGPEARLPSIQWGTLLGVSRLGCEGDRFPHLVPRLRMNAALLASFHMPSWCASGYCYLYLCVYIYLYDTVTFIYVFTSTFTSIPNIIELPVGENFTNFLVIIFPYNLFCLFYLGSRHLSCAPYH